jgi:hypothetical protein
MKSGNDKQILLYTTADGKINLRVAVSPKENTAWLTQAQMVELFNSSKSNISEHISHILADGELDEISVVRDYRTTATDGKDYNTKFYNLDMIISVGYRVNSLRGVQFRKWATGILNEYIRKGFAMNDELLKEAGGGNYFKELIQRIRDIRSSEKVFYRQILDIYATSIDYDPKASETQEFFKIVQNKMFFAVNKMTAPEIIVERANAKLPFMGLTAFRGTRPQKSEIVTAKNYLTEDEITKLNRITSMYLDYAEDQAEQEHAMKMKDWTKKLDGFLQFNKKEILQNAGSTNHETAIDHAEKQYDIYKVKSMGELTQVEKDFLENIKTTYKLLEKKDKK